MVWRIFEPWDGFQRFDDYFAELFAYFAQPDAWSLYPEVSETLSALEKRGMVLSVISNFDSRLIGILEGLGAAPWFEHIFVSSRVGYAKPDRQIFHTALERHSLKAGDALHIGDSEEKDLHGANKAGLRESWSNVTAKSPESFATNHELTGHSSPFGRLRSALKVT